ncbi:MAG: DciA family protein [Pseudomonadota bacterium]
MALKNQPTPLGALLPAALPAKLAGRLPGPGLLNAWREQAGELTARRARPVCLEPGGVLVVAVENSIWRQDVALRLPRLLAGLKAAGQTVENIKLVLMRTPPPPAPPPLPEPELGPDQEAAVERLVAGVADPDLRASLAAVYRAQLKAEMANPGSDT